MEFEIKRLAGNDLPVARKLFMLLQEVFEVKNPSIPGDAYIRTLLGNPGFICLAATFKDEVIGGLTAYELPMYYSASSELFIYDIGVKPGFQRMSLGKKLITAVKDHCRENNIAQFFVDANEEDKHALDFYRAQNGKEEKVVQFTFDV